MAIHSKKKREEAKRFSRNQVQGTAAVAIKKLKAKAPAKKLESGDEEDGSWIWLRRRVH